MSLTDIIAGVASVAAVVSAIYAGMSANAARVQAEHITRKVGMISDPEKMFDVLPVWYVERMSTDYWCFGLLLTSGSILAIKRIEGLSDDKQWLEVELATKDEGPDTFSGASVIFGLNDRRHASVRLDQVQAAFELVTS